MHHKTYLKLFRLYVKFFQITGEPTTRWQSSQYLDCIIEEPLHGYDGSNKGDPNGQASYEQITKPDTFHGMYDVFSLFVVQG